MKRAVVRVGVIVAVGGLAGCTSSPGPLQYGGGDWCAPAQRYPEVALGAPLDLPHGAQPITIDAVTAVNPQGLSVADVYVMPVDPRLRTGVVPFPPDLPGWSDARPGIGATVEAGESVDLVARVVYEGPGEASFDSLKIVYSQDGAQYEADTNMGVRLVDADSCADDPTRPSGTVPVAAT